METAKEKVIKREWGLNYEKFKPNNNGWSTKMVMYQDVDWWGYDVETIAHGMYNIRPKSLQGIENNNGWTKIESEDTIPEQGVIVLGFSEDWIDEDFNPLGQRQCHCVGIYPDLEWISAKWWDYQDTWTNDEKTKPTHFQQIEKKNSPIF